MKHQSIIGKMTLEEKASLMSGKSFWNTKPIERLNVPTMMMTDGPHGLRKQTASEDHLGLSGSYPATCYPTASCSANSWDEELLFEMGRHLGIEASSEGVGMVLGPGVNIKRDPLCGRNFEYYSEDPLLAGRCAAAMIRGIQSEGVSACVKHFAANSQEHLRMSNDSVVDERTLREIYLPAFETAVKEGKTRGLMTSYNMVNGQYANENMHLLRDILRGEWGYKGLIVSDWGGNCDRVAAIRAGSTLEMPSTAGETDRQIVEAVRTGELDEALLDEQVDNLLEMVFTAQENLRERKVYDIKEHHAFAAKVAEGSAVLLKNDGGLLPIDGTKRAAVIGDFAFEPRYQGAGSSLIEPTVLTCALDTLRAEGASIIGRERGFRRSGRPDGPMLERAVALAREADVVLLFLGLDDLSEAEGVDRAGMAMPANQIHLLREISRANPNVAVILSCGSPVEMEWDRYAKAVLHMYLGGQAGADAAARLIMGKAVPCGKLAESVPMRYEDAPAAGNYPGAEATAEYREGLYIGYRYYLSANVPVKYPFGYGMSYTRFEYSDLKATREKVSFTVKNVGGRAGAEIAELYIEPRTNGTFRPKRELKGFKKVFLEAGESRELEISLSDRSFAYWSIERNGWATEPGAYAIEIGASCEDIRLTQEIILEGEPVADPYADSVFDVYRAADVKHVSDESFAALLGREIPPAHWPKNGRLGFNSAIAQGRTKKHGVGRLLYDGVKLVQRTMALIGKEKYSVEVNFVLNMPYRGLSRLTGAMSDKAVYAILKIANGEKGGFRELLKK